MKVETTTSTTIRCNLDELRYGPEGLPRDHYPDTNLIGTFAGKHQDVYEIYRHIARDGIINFWVTVTDRELLIRLMSLDTKCREQHFLPMINDLLDQRDGVVTIELEVMWDITTKRVIKIEKEVFQNKSFMLTLSLV
jgi:hypothetical protein